MLKKNNPKITRNESTEDNKIPNKTIRGHSKQFNTQINRLFGNRQTKYTQSSTPH